MFLVLPQWKTCRADLHACPLLWSASHGTLARRQQACINKGKLITRPQKDGWLNLLWFAAVLPWALALFKCAHHVQLQDKSAHSHPPDLSCWMWSSTKRAARSRHHQTVSNQEKKNMMIHPRGQNKHRRIVAFVFLRSVFPLKKKPVYKHVRQGVRKHQGQSWSWFLTCCYPALSFPTYPFIMCRLIRETGCHLLILALQPLRWNSHLNSNGGPTLPSLSLGPFQTSTLKIYSVGDKQDAAALRPWRSWRLTRLFTDVLCDWAKTRTLSLTPSQQLPLKTQTRLWHTEHIQEVTRM